MEDAHDVKGIASASQSCITAFKTLQGHLSANSVDKAESTSEHHLATTQERSPTQPPSDAPGLSTVAATHDWGSSVESSAISMLSHENDVAFARFRIWTGNLGALQRGTSSLDVRLREVNVVRLAIVQILNSLQDTLNECTKVVSGERLPYEKQASYLDQDAHSSDEESDQTGSDDEDDFTELEMRARSLKTLLAELYRLSFKIRNKSVRGNNSRAMVFSYLDKDSGIDLFSVYEELDRRHVFEHLSNIRPFDETDKMLATGTGDGGKARAVWPTLDNLAVDRLAEQPLMVFGHMSNDLLACRLAQANTARRRHFAYWRRHALKLSADREPSGTPDIPDRPVATGTVTLPEPTLPLPTHTVPTIISGTEATKLDPKVEDTLDTETVISYATTVFGLECDAVELPAPPLAAATQPEFRCDICHVVCPSKQGKGREWRMHVLHDLQPYVCTYQNCNTAHTLYSSRNTWLEHERVVHRRFWQCHEHASMTFKSKEAFQEHLDRAHDNISVAHAKQIASFAEATEADARVQCPFCLHHGPFSNGLHNHMAFHQECIAAFTLSRSVGAASDDSPSSRAQGSPSTASLSELEFYSEYDAGSAPFVAITHPDVVEREVQRLVGMGHTEEEARETVSRMKGDLMVARAVESYRHMKDLDQNHAKQGVRLDTKDIAQWQQEISVGPPGRDANWEEQGTDPEHDMHEMVDDGTTVDHQYALERDLVTPTIIAPEQHHEDLICLGLRIYRPEEMQELLRHILTNVSLDEVFDAKLGTFRNCTNGADITYYIMKHLGASIIFDAERIGRDLMDNGLLRRIVKTNASHYQWTAKSFQLAGLPEYHPLEFSAVGLASGITPKIPGESYHEARIRSLGEKILYLSMVEGVITDSELTTVANALQFLGKAKWSTVPRLYLILRSIDQIDVLDDFIDQGASDTSFPFTDRSLPAVLSPTSQEKFLQLQSVVLSQVQLFERDPGRKHVHFEKAESLPFHSIGWLGSGAHAHVDRVVSMVTHCEYARKTFRRPRGNRKEPFERFLKELQVLKTVRHYHCVELCASYTDPKYFGILMLPVADSTLSEYYSLAHVSVEKLKVLRTFFGCLAEALQYLHGKSIRHKDIKPKNILVKGDLVFLTDFGVAINWDDLTASTTTGPFSITRKYAAPEVLDRGKSNSSADIWSLGCVFIEMLSVLKGSSVDALRTFLRPQAGTDSFDPKSDRLKEWLNILRAQGDMRDNCIIKWVSAMLEHEPELRPTAAMLYLDIAQVREDQDLAFCGICCMPEHDPSENEDGVDDDH